MKELVTATLTSVQHNTKCMTTPQLSNLISVHWLSVLKSLEKNMKKLLTATLTSVQHNIKCMTTPELSNLISVQWLSV